ncbi:VOC family protein [Amycolatopsis lurida]|uniref:VOC family protein n=1 Tax=Amycolatopsis sp. YIM 10 TaxID=2653857 RepID=UPI0012A9BB77|nr:VOC family protein [Amycolatopsis sp. YIM 10]QFU87506.1 Glyoxalase-like domain protein [Amycolatopsis sp. YIM 10]
MAKRPANLVDTVHPRLLVDNFAECFRFYDRILPQLAAAKPGEGGADGPYARWDSDGKPILAVLDRAAMAATLAEISPSSAGEAVLLVFRLADVDAAQRLLEENGATVVRPAADYPEWGPETRMAHLRDPAGNLVELQSSPD